MRRMRNQKGFTIMELMIVIVIIGILIAIAVPAYNSFIARARTATCQANQRTLESADGLLFADTGSHADDVADLGPYLNNAATILCPSSGIYSFAGGVVTCSFAGH